MKKLLWLLLVSGSLLAPAAFTQEPPPQNASLSAECQRLQDEMDLRIEMQSMKSVSKTSPAYMAWLQQQIDACKRRQNRSANVPEKGSKPLETFPDGHIPSPPNGHIPEPIDWSHLNKNPPRPLPSDGAKDEQDRSKADSPPPTS